LVYCGFIATIGVTALSDRAAGVIITSSCERVVGAELGFALPKPKDVSFQTQKKP